MSLYNSLAGRISTSQAELSFVVARVSDYLGKALKSDDQAYWDALALNIYGYYAGVEHIFEDIARTVEASPPTSQEWHSDLLLQMASEIRGIRPPVITPETRACLDEYRGFRHVVRNVYSFNLRPSRIKELAESLPACYKNVSKELILFGQFLNTLG